MPTEKNITKKEKWKPKRKWIKSFVVSLKSHGNTKYNYYVPKSEEEEERMIKEYDAKIDRIFDRLFTKMVEKDSSLLKLISKDKTVGKSDFTKIKK
jgi:hypothetical protein